MANRFYVPELEANSTAALVDNQAHHAINVMRLAVGDQVILFDGKGSEFNAIVEKMNRKQVDLSVLQPNNVDREAPVHVTIAAAMPKGDRQRWMIEKLTEVGVRRFVPLVCKRSTVKVGDSLLKKLGRYVVEASKQCGRNHLMEVLSPVGFAEILNSDSTSDCSRLICSTIDGVSLTAGLSSLSTATAEVCFLIGPEGGFTTEEMELAHAAKWQSVSLSNSILRIETAAVAAAAATIATEMKLDS